MITDLSGTPVIFKVSDQIHFDVYSTHFIGLK